jgi:SAM-dependent methyltransferase
MHFMQMKHSIWTSLRLAMSQPKRWWEGRRNGRNARSQVADSIPGQQSTAMTLPDVVEPEIYRHLWSDLAMLSDGDLVEHFRLFGEAEGRQANRLTTRGDFVGLIPHDVDALEIGPFFQPLLTGPNVRFFDVLSQADLTTRARAIGEVQTNAPVIDFVSPTGDLSIVDQSFSYVLSSHCLEHQPDMIAHLKQVERILQPGGQYFILVPDKRYCFDAFISESTIAEVLDAHHARRQTHLLKSVIEHRALTTHNDSARHWVGDHGPRFQNHAARVEGAIREYEAANGAYIDVHAWYLTPGNASSLMTTLRYLGYINLELERVYPSRRPANEFWMVLRKPDLPPAVTQG